MAQTALDIRRGEYVGFQEISIAPESSSDQSALSFPSRTVIRLGVFLAVLQILDGVLTAIGVMHFGTSAEGNLLLKTLMEVMGYGTAIFLVKSLGILIIACLCFVSKTVTWLENAFKVIIFVYLGGAIIPWALIITYQIL